jgi:protein-disulfide isomerase
MHYVCKHGFEHHVAMTQSHSAAVLEEAFSNYLGWETYSARIGARIGECVYRQSNDTFWEMKSPLYRAQSELDSTRRAEELALMYAPGIEEASFRACLAADDSLQRVRADRAVATGLNLRGTPSVAVNGSPLPAATLAEIRRAVEAALR